MKVLMSQKVCRCGMFKVEPPVPGNVCWRYFSQLYAFIGHFHSICRHTALKCCFW